ncbi:Retrovirus-related Pol polyprotein from transposon RE1 [Senna tora]|uniref:Retrovirus-related Pol polyprotein from transposon RE1 n=1 Tax=Senna tora TaxID=362788 RepID=A0A834SQ96_9FABA|nr:Retrovirus-related Pol polyprotein from transposon RE1 [Senna tora]
MTIRKDAPAFADQSNQAFSAGEHRICIAVSTIKELEMRICSLLPSFLPPYPNPFLLQNCVRATLNSRGKPRPAKILSAMWCMEYGLWSEASELSMENSNSNSGSFTVGLLSAKSSKGQYISFNHNISVKLEEKNFLLWKQQVLTAIQGNDLQKFIEGVHSVPPLFETVEDKVTEKVSSEYIAWAKHWQPPSRS